MKLDAETIARLRRVYDAWERRKGSERDREDEMVAAFPALLDALEEARERFRVAEDALVETRKLASATIQPLRAQVAELTREKHEFTEWTQRITGEMLRAANLSDAAQPRSCKEIVEKRIIPRVSELTREWGAARRELRGLDSAWRDSTAESTCLRSRLAALEKVRAAGDALRFANRHFEHREEYSRLESEFYAALWEVGDA